MLQGVENPVSVMLHPVVLSPACRWYAGDNSGLLWGINIDRMEIVKGADDDEGDKTTFNGLISYAPVLMPRVWEDDTKAVRVVVEHETEDNRARYAMRAIYGCGDPSEFAAIESEAIEGHPGKRIRMSFPLDLSRLIRGELLRVSLLVTRHNDLPVIVYGAWLEAEI